MERKGYNLRNQSKIILTYYQKDLDPILKGHYLCIYYMIKLYFYTICHHQLYTMKSL
jgi:hypothetical protein